MAAEDRGQTSLAGKRFGISLPVKKDKLVGISPANLCLHAESAVDRKRDGGVHCLIDIVTLILWVRAYP